MPEHSIDGRGPFLVQYRGKLSCTCRIGDRTTPHSGLVGSLGGIFRNHLTMGDFASQYSVMNDHTSI